VIVGALVWEQTARARLTEALRGEAAIRYCDLVGELLTLVEHGLAGIAIVDMRDRDGNSTLAAVRRIRDGYSSVPVVLYCALNPDTSRDVLEFARAGVNDLVLRGVDDLRVTLRGAVQNALDHSSARSITAEIEPLVPNNVLPILRYSLENGRRNLSVEELADALAVHRKTLVDRLNAAGFPSPSSVISWCRLLVAARLLDDPGRSVEQVALLLDFPSGTSLRNMMKRYTGLASTEVRENGGVRCVLHAFKRDLSLAKAGRVTGEAPMPPEGRE
jgi:AraC-like DNA-binding protein